MTKPRIIIADTDINYMAPLQQKFAEKYFDKIELEAITDRKYYEQLFSAPQKADILIVAEKLYDSEVLHHDIRHIFVMTEQHTGNDTSDGSICKIYKYSSMKEIMPVIEGQASDCLQNSGVVKKTTQILLVCSACGGVGKTTVALGLSACLYRNYKRVLYMNAARLQSFQTLLSNESPIASPEIYAVLRMPEKSVYSEIQHAIRNEGFSYLPPFKAALMSLGVDYSIFGKIALSAKEANAYDYIVIDADTVLDEEKSRLIDIADRVMVVTRQNKASVCATNAFVSNVNGIKTDKFIFVCNDFESEKANALTDSVNKFGISEYIRHFLYYDQLKATELADKNDIQKLTFYVL